MNKTIIHFFITLLKKYKKNKRKIFLIVILFFFLLFFIKNIFLKIKIENFRLIKIVKKETEKLNKLLKKLDIKEYKEYKKKNSSFFISIRLFNKTNWKIEKVNNRYIITSHLWRREIFWRKEYHHWIDIIPINSDVYDLIILIKKNNNCYFLRNAW